MLRCHAGQHTVCPIDRAIPQKPGDQNRREVTEEFGRKIMRPTESNNRAVGVKEPLTCGLQKFAASFPEMAKQARRS